MDLSCDTVSDWRLQQTEKPSLPPYLIPVYFKVLKVALLPHSPYAKVSGINVNVTVWFCPGSRNHTAGNGRVMDGSKPQGEQE